MATLERFSTLPSATPAKPPKDLATERSDFGPDSLSSSIKCFHSPQALHCPCQREYFSATFTANINSLCFSHDIYLIRSCLYRLSNTDISTIDTFFYIFISIRLKIIFLNILLKMDP